MFPAIRRCRSIKRTFEENFCASPSRSSGWKKPSASSRVAAMRLRLVNSRRWWTTSSWRAHSVVHRGARQRRATKALPSPCATAPAASPPWPAPAPSRLSVPCHGRKFPRMPRLSRLVLVACAAPTCIFLRGTGRSHCRGPSPPATSPAGVTAEGGAHFTHTFWGKPLGVGSKEMRPPLMPCGRCYYCVHYPERANKCLTPVYYGRYLGFDKPPHLWGGFAEYVYVDLDMLPGTKVYKLPDDMPLRLGALSEP